RRRGWARSVRGAARRNGRARRRRRTAARRNPPRPHLPAAGPAPRPRWRCAGSPGWSRASALVRFGVGGRGRGLRGPVEPGVELLEEPVDDPRLARLVGEGLTDDPGRELGGEATDLL